MSIGNEPVHERAWKTTIAALTIVALAFLLALRFVGLYSHQALAVALMVGVVWAILGRGGIVWKGRLRAELHRAIHVKWDRQEFRNAIGRASFWGITTATCLWVFPRSAELLTIIAVLGALGVFRIAISFITPLQSYTPVTVVMVLAGAVMLVDLGRTVFRVPAVVEIAVPFQGEWLVAQGGSSPLQNHHLAAFNQHFAVDLVRLDNGYIYDGSGDTDGNAAVYGWEQPLRSPVNGHVVFARDDMEDAEGVGTVTTATDSAGNAVVIELESGLYVVLAHLRHESLQVDTGDLVRTGDFLAQVGNSGNTTLPHLHLQVQTHVDMWHPDNRSVPFAFETDGRVPVRNDRVSGMR